MSTVDYEIALSVAKGEYPEDNWYAVIAYLPPFPNADVAYKLAKDSMGLDYAIDSFTSRGIPQSIIWMRKAHVDTFKHNDGEFRRWVQNKRNKIMEELEDIFAKPD